MVGKKPRLQIDVESPVAVYRQIVDALRANLVEGDLLPGEALPSVRRLAIELGITFNTVAQAYRELAEEGWLDLRHGRRVMVVERTAREGASREQMKMFRRRLRELTAEMRAEGASAGALARELRGLAEILEGS